MEICQELYSIERIIDEIKQDRLYIGLTEKLGTDKTNTIYGLVERFYKKYKTKIDKLQVNMDNNGLVFHTFRHSFEVAVGSLFIFGAELEFTDVENEHIESMMEHLFLSGIFHDAGMDVDEENSGHEERSLLIMTKILGEYSLDLELIGNLIDGTKILDFKSGLQSAQLSIEDNRLLTKM